MFRIILRVLTLFIIFDFSLSRWSMDGQMQTFIFSRNQRVDDAQINWLFDNGAYNFTYFTCSISIKYGNICVPYLDTFDEFFSANITSNSTSVISVFTINHVNLSLHNSVWFCSVDFNQDKASVRFDLRVFAAAECLTCDEVTLLNERNIQIDCGTNNVFPGPTCLFTVKTNGSSEYELKQGHIRYTQDQNLTTLYYKTTCTLVVSAAILGPGSHMFRVVMYPNITSDITEEMKRTSQYTTAINLGFPKAVLASDCQVNNYIRENENRTCTCYNNKTTIIPTYVIWSKNGKINTFNGKMEFLASRPSFDPASFVCTVTNSLNMSDHIIYQPNVAYGPNGVDLMLTNEEKIICDEENLHIVGACLVSDSNPLPTVYIIVNDSLNQLKPGTEQMEYKFNISVPSPGNFNVSCVAYNPIFGDISSKTNANVHIKGSPKSPIITSISHNAKITPSNNVVSVYEGITTIICESEDQSSLNKNISLRCGNFQRYNTNEKEAFLILNVSIETGSINCSCEVWTDSSCQKKTAGVMLQIFQYNANARRETNVVAIGLGVVAGLAILILLAVVVMFILHYKKSKQVHKRDLKKSEIYSDLKDPDLPDNAVHYEMPTLNSPISPEERIVMQAAIIDQTNLKTRDPKNTLVGFIVTDIVNEKTPKQEKNLYEEVTDTIEFADKNLMINKENPSYLNVK